MVASADGAVVELGRPRAGLCTQEAGRTALARTPRAVGTEEGTVGKNKAYNCVVLLCILDAGDSFFPPRFFFSSFLPGDGFVALLNHDCLFARSCCCRSNCAHLSAPRPSRCCSFSRNVKKKMERKRVATVTAIFFRS